MGKEKKDLNASSLIEFSQKKKKEVVEAAKELAYPEGDPRNNMTPEEIQEFMRKEEEELDKKLNKFVSVAPKVDADEVEEDEEDEDFTIDFEKKVVKQKIKEGIIPIEDPQVFNSDMLKDGLVGAFDFSNPYQSILTNVFVRKAIISMIRSYRDAECDLYDFKAKMPKETAEGLEEERKKIEQKIRELRAALKPGEFYFLPVDAQVDYGSIPVWAEKEIKSKITEAVAGILSLTILDS